MAAALRMRSWARSLACIIGWPVQSSFSPAIHNAAFRAAGLDWTYVPLPVPPGAVAEGIELVRRLEVAGANVTIPHKQAAIAHLDATVGDATVFGAVNTIVREGARLVGHNTDGAGFVRFLRADAGWEPAGRSALVIGAGGAGRAVALGLAAAGSRVTVAARRPEQAEEVAALAPGIARARWGTALPADLLVNATPVREGLPYAPLHGQLIVDLIYQPPDTALLAAARGAGARAYDGIGMLVHQAALSFQLWTGLQAPADVMRAAAERARNEATHASRAR